MTKEEFISILCEIDGAYPSFTVTENLADVWYKHLGKFEHTVLNKAVTEYIHENSRPPAISDFYGRCEKITRFNKSREVFK